MLGFLHVIAIEVHSSFARVVASRVAREVALLGTNAGSTEASCKGRLQEQMKKSFEQAAQMIAIKAGVRLPGYLSVSQDLKFSDVPAGCFASLEAVPTAGWLQIMVLLACRSDRKSTPDS